MLTHTEYAGVQQQACETLRSLTCDTTNQVKIAEAGGIRAVNAAIKAHKNTVRVQQHACC